MPWIDGRAPDRWARPLDGVTRSRREILRLMCDICDAIGHAHQRGVIHRDLKPSNILVDAQNKPHVLDFGIGKLLVEDQSSAQELTRTTEFVGSPTYAPPERLLTPGAPADVRDDVYSLGVLLYGLLADAEPYPFGDTLASAIRALQEREPTPIRRHAPNLERDLAVVVHKAIAKEPNERYASVEAFRAELQRFLDGQAVLAHPPSQLYRLQKFVRRNPLVTALTTLSAGLILGFAIYANHQNSNLEKERNDAVEARGLAAAEAERTHDALGFLIEEVLGQLDPALRGRVASVPEILRDASSDLSQRFGADPDLEIEVRVAIGRMQLRNGDYMGASSQFERANSLLPASLHPNRMTDHNRCDLALLSAEAALNQARFRLAQQQLEQVDLMLQDAKPSANQSDAKRLTLLRIRLGLAKGEVEYAESTCLAALAKLEGTDSSDAATPAQSIRDLDHHWQNQLLLVLILRSSGRAAQAVGLAEEMIKTAQQRHPEGTHIDLADATREWGWSLFHAGELREAEAPLREALSLRQKLLGPLHPDVAQSLMDVATWSQFFGEDPHVIRTQFEEAVEILRSSGSGQQQLIAGAWSGLAGLATDAGDFDQADALYREALALLAKRFGAKHPMLAGLHMDLGLLQTQRKQFNKARISLEYAVSLHEGQGGNRGGHRDRPTWLMAMAQNEEAAGEFGASIDYYRRAADALIEEVPGGCVPLLVCLNGLARGYDELVNSDAAQLARQEAQEWQAKIDPKRLITE